MIEESLSIIVDKIGKLTHEVRVGLAPRSSHSQRQATFPDNVCSYSPPVTVCHTIKICLLLFFSGNFLSSPKQLGARTMGKRDGNTNTKKGAKTPQVRNMV
jgi:hypothetical protein